MKITIAKSFAVVMMLTMFNLITFGQTAERIKVPKGKTDAEISGNLAAKRVRDTLPRLEKV